MKVRHFHKIECVACRRMCWTSSRKRQYLCVACKKARGLNVSGRAGYGEGYTTLAALQIVRSWGTCEKCHRDGLALVNGRCEDCRFYGLGDVDRTLSERARRALGGEFDWIKH